MSAYQRLVVDAFRLDLAAWQRHGWSEHSFGRRSALKMLWHQAGLRATLLYRVAHWASVCHLPVLPSLLCQVNIAVHAIELPSNVPVGAGLYLPHTVGTVVNAEGIGSNATIQGGVTVGMRTTPAFPLIGDNVILGAGCRVLGGIRLGDNVSVGANSVVITDVPSGTTVVGIPGRAVHRINESARLGPATLVASTPHGPGDSRLGEGAELAASRNIRAD